MEWKIAVKGQFCGFIDKSIPRYNFKNNLTKILHPSCSCSLQ
jgi:hypothetical protein